MDRRQELERKKAKLQAMKEERKRKEEERKRSGQTGETPKATASSTGPVAGGEGTDLRLETEQMLKDLGIPTEGASPRVSANASPAPQAAAQATQAIPKRKVTLTTSKVTQTNIPPRENVSYCKETQTPHETIDKEVARHWDYYALTYVDLDDDGDSMGMLDTVGPPAGVQAGGTRMPQPEPPKPAVTAEEVASPKEEEKPAPIRELTEEEKMKIMMSEDFQKFVDRSARIIERAIYEEVDIITDYTGADKDDMESALGEGEKLKLNRQFFDERWSKHRTVTCIDWSVQFPELLVASYNNNEDSPHEPDGVALIWNIKYKKNTPEYIFHCQSAVMSTCFAKFHPNLIIGGTYSGQIVLWDNRSNKRTPVQRTPLSAAAHTHPVYCVNVVGTQNAHNLMSVSTDGKLCSWSLDMLSAPQDSMELQNKQSKSVAATCFSFLAGDVNNFVVGSEEGPVYTACRHGSKAGINDSFEGHMGPVTGIDCNTVPGSIDFSQYFLTSSFDWTVKLWNIKENRALHSFEDNSEYVYDARWSPVHPALFATVDGAGRLDMWNLNNDTEVPTASTVVEGNTALNKCLWHQSGHSIAVGDDMGKIHIYDVGEPVSVPRSDEWSRFVHTLQEMKTNQAEEDEDLAKPLR